MLWRIEIIDETDDWPRYQTELDRHWAFIFNFNMMIGIVIWNNCHFCKNRMWWHLKVTEIIFVGPSPLFDYDLLIFLSSAVTNTKLKKTKKQNGMNRVRRDFRKHQLQRTLNHFLKIDQISMIIYIMIRIKKQ